MVKHKSVTFIIFVLLRLILASDVYGNLSFEDILLGIESRESRLKTLEVQYEVVLPDHKESPGKKLKEACDYRLEGGKQFLRYEKLLSTGIKNVVTRAFDGERIRAYGTQTKTGQIRLISGDDFNDPLLPLAFYGYRLEPKLTVRKTLGVSIRNATGG